MPATIVEAKIPTTDQEMSVEYNFGDSLAEAIDLFGEATVFSNFKSACVVTLQGFMRGQMRADKEGNTKSEEEVQTAVSGWAPGQRTTKGKSKAEKLRDLLQGMDGDQITALLAQANEPEAV